VALYLTGVNALLGEDYKLAPGDVLIAPPRMQDTRFAKSVIMVTNFRNGAAFGLCLNKPSSHSVQDLTPELDVPLTENIPLYWGGPVNSQTIWMLHSADWMIDSSVQINRYWAMTSNTAMFHHLSDGDCPRHYIITFGFCGWSQGQLEAELKGEQPWTVESSWLTWRQPDSHLLEAASSELWRVGCEQSSHQAVSSWL
jgi:putative transcriptional regulator